MSSTIKRRSTPNTRGEEPTFSTIYNQPSSVVIDVKPHTPLQKYTQSVPVIVSGYQHPYAGIVVQQSPYVNHIIAPTFTPYCVVQAVTPHVVIPVQPKFQIGYPPHFIRY